NRLLAPRNLRIALPSEPASAQFPGEGQVLGRETPYEDSREKLTGVRPRERQRASTPAKLPLQAPTTSSERRESPERRGSSPSGPASQGGMPGPSMGLRSNQGSSTVTLQIQKPGPTS